jgi:hypothetical protein
LLSGNTLDTRSGRIRESEKRKPLKQAKQPLE